MLQQANEILEQRVAAAVAERIEAEAQLRQAQKMEAVGKLTGGVAHDFNNVLQVIGGNLQLLMRDVAGSPRAKERLQTAVSAISRGSKLASQLLAFGRRQPLALKVINLGRLIRGIDDMLRRAWMKASKSKRSSRAVCGTPLSTRFRSRTRCSTWRSTPGMRWTVTAS